VKWNSVKSQQASYQPLASAAKTVAEPINRNVATAANLRKTDSSTSLQRMQIRHQIFDLLVVHDLAKPLHLGASILSDFRYAVVVGRKSAH
jgi:hypothetical protein